MLSDDSFILITTTVKYDCCSVIHHYKINYLLEKLFQ